MDNPDVLRYSSCLSFWVYAKDIRSICNKRNVCKNEFIRFFITNITNDVIFINDNTFEVKLTSDIGTYGLLTYDMIRDIKICDILNITIDESSDMKFTYTDGKKVMKDIIHLKHDSDSHVVEILYNALDISGMGIAVKKSKYIDLMNKAINHNKIIHELFAAPFNRIISSYSSLFPYVSAERKLGACLHAREYLNSLIGDFSAIMNNCNIGIYSQNATGIILAVNPPFEMTIMEETLEQILTLLNSNKRFSIEIFMTIPVWDIASQKELFIQTAKSMSKIKNKNFDPNEFYEQNKHRNSKYGKWRFLQLWKNVLHYKDKEFKFDKLIKMIKESKYLSSFNSYIANDYEYTLYDTPEGKTVSGICDTHEILMYKNSQ